MAVPVLAPLVAALAVVSTRDQSLAVAGHSAAALLGAAAAALTFVHHRQTGHANAAAVGAALVGLTAMQTLWAWLDAGMAPTGLVWTAARAGGTAVVAAALFDAVRAPVVNTGFRPLRLAVAACGGVALAAGAPALLGAGTTLGGRSVVAATWTVIGLSLTAAAVWCERRSRNDVTGRDAPRRGVGAGFDWLTVVLAGLGLGAGLEGLAAGTGASGWAFGARLLTVAAALAAVVGSGHDLMGTFTRNSGRLLRSQVDREATEAVQEEESAVDRKRVHDVRSALTGISAATATLEHYSHKLRPEQAERLRNDVRTEIARLQQLIAPAHGEGPDGFPLQQALASLSIGVHGALRYDVPADLHAGGSQIDTAAAVRHLVDAVHQAHHGAVVTITGRAVGDRIHVGVGLDDPVTAADGRPDRLVVLTARRLVQPAGGDVVAGRDGTGPRYRLDLPLATVAAGDPDAPGDARRPPRDEDFGAWPASR